MKTINKVAIYYRVSSKKQVEDDTIEAQRTNLPKWAEAQGWTVVKEYEDPGIGGWTLDRPELQQMLADVRNKKYDAVVIRYFSRLIRDASWDTLGAVMGAFEVGQCNIESPQDGSITSNNIVGKIMALVQAWSAQKDNEDKKVAVREGIEKAQRNNKIVKTPFGVRWKELENKQGYYYVDEREHQTLTKLIALLLSGHSLTSIVDLLNGDPHYCPRYAKRWTHGSLWALIQNDFLYHGMINGKYALVKTRKSLFKRKDIEKARHCLVANRKLGDNIARKISRDIFLLRRLVKCQDCGWRMSLQRYETRAYYRCKKCGLGVRADHYDTLAWDKFKTTLTDPEALKTAILSESYLPDTQRQQDLEVMRKNYQATMADLVEKKQRATDLYIDGEVDREHLRQRMGELDKGITKAQNELRRVENECRRPEELDAAVYEATKAMVIEIAKMQRLEYMEATGRVESDNTKDEGEPSELVYKQKRQMFEQLIELGGSIIVKKDKTLQITSDLNLFNQTTG